MTSPLYVTDYYAGLDLGQARDHTAIAVLELSELSAGQGPVTWQRIAHLRRSVRYLDRLPLGLPCQHVVEHVRCIVQRPELAATSALVVDVGGVARPVVDLLRRMGLPRVPKRNLTGGLAVLFQRAETFVRELANIRIKSFLEGHDTHGAWWEGGHDDLVVAAALAGWRSRPPYSLAGTRLLI